MATTKKEVSLRGYMTTTKREIARRGYTVKELCVMYGIKPHQLYHQPELFPPMIKIGGKLFALVEEVEKWERKKLAESKRKLA